MCACAGAHTHTYSDIWSKDDNGHWHASTCGHNVTADNGEHEFDGNGCTVCGYKKTSTPPTSDHKHAYAEDWKFDDYYHWHVATCGHNVIDGKAPHDMIGDECSVCDYAQQSQGGNDGGDQGGDGKTVTVKFLAGDGAFRDGKNGFTAVADADGHVSMTVDPVYDGHAFDGWYDGAKKFDPSESFGESKTFTAKYVSGNTDEVYSALFDEQSIVGIDMDMSDAEWKKLDRDHTDFKNKGGKSPIYRLADSVTISIYSGGKKLDYYYEEVGVRMKGNTSRRNFYSDSGFYNNIHMKLSFKQTFDDVDDGYSESELKVWEDLDARAARKDRMFGGMEKIDIKYNSTSDETYVRELYAMKLFRENGVVAPNVTLCSLTALEKDSVKKNLGVYRIHEPIDETFVARKFGDETAGDLWKCTYTGKGPADMTNYDLDNRVGVEDELKGEFYSYDKKTNKKKDKETGLRDFSSIKNFINAVNNNGADISQYLDTDNFAKFEAVNYILGNPDCIRNNYNNYYLYFRKSDGKAVVIPYDYDRCLGITKDWDPTGSASMYVKPFDGNIAANGSGQNNPVYKKLICQGAPYGEGSTLDLYRTELLRLASSAQVTAESFNAYVSAYSAKYGNVPASALGSNSLRFGADNTGNVSYGNYMTTKLQTLTENIDNYR